MRILCDQMVKERFVSVLESEDRHTVARIGDRLTPDAADNTIAAYAAQREHTATSAASRGFTGAERSEAPGR